MADLQSLADTIDLNCFGENLTGRAIKQGYTFFWQRFIHNIVIGHNENETDVKALCHRSMRKNEKPHTMTITFMNKQNKVVFSTCSCTAGQVGTCAHVIGLVHTLKHYKLMGCKEVPDDVSCTSVAQQWSVPRGPKIKPQPVVQLLMAKPTNVNRKRRPIASMIMSNDVAPSTSGCLKRLKDNFSHTPLSYLIEEDTPLQDSQLGLLQHNAPLKYKIRQYRTSLPAAPCPTPCGNTKFPINNKIIVLTDKINECNQINPTSWDEAHKIEGRTVYQNNSEDWKKERLNRLTASNFYRVLNRRKNVNESFLRSLFRPKSFTSEATSYGLACEKTARRQYSSNHPNHHLHDCGLVINPLFNYLGASPDGKVCIDNVCGIVEIKSPFSARDMTINDALHLPNFCLEDHSGQARLRCDHEYYTQVQGQLFVTGAPFCIFLVYTRLGMHCEKIEPNMSYQNDMFIKLTEFYFTHAIPYLKSLDNN